MNPLYTLDRTVAKDAVPSGWLIEYNSNLGLTALACDGQTLDRLVWRVNIPAGKTGVILMQ